MKRKVIQLAQKTLVVSLPAKWTKRFTILKGDEIELTERGNTLLISPDKDAGAGATSVKIGSIFLRRLVDTPYRMGYNEIRFEYDDPSTYHHIQNEVNMLMGFEIIKQGDGYCIAKNLAQGIESEFETSLNRLFLVILGFLEDIKKHFTNPEKLATIQNTEDITNRLAHFCKRMVNLELHRNTIRSRSVYRIICLLEETGDEAKRICRRARNPSDEQQSLLSDIIKQFRLCYHLYCKYDESQLSSYGKLEKQIGKKIESSLEKNDSSLTCQLEAISENIKHISEEVF